MLIGRSSVVVAGAALFMLGMAGGIMAGCASSADSSGTGVAAGAGNLGGSGSAVGGSGSSSGGSGQNAAGSGSGQDQAGTSSGGSASSGAAGNSNGSGGTSAGAGGNAVGGDGNGGEPGAGGETGGDAGGPGSGGAGSTDDAWTQCTDSNECVLTPMTCCGSCGAVTPDDAAAVNSQYLDEYRNQACDGPGICPACFMENDPRVSTLCDNGHCIVELALD